MTDTHWSDDLRDLSLGEPPLPEWVTSLRDHQVAAVDEILGHYAAGVKYVLVNAPTGAGKTLIGEMVRRRLNAPKTIYVATTKSLQDQFASDFHYSRVLKGRANYRTLDFYEEFDDPFNPITAADCNRTMDYLPACGSCTDTTEDKVPHCTLCHPTFLCPYEVAKRGALAAPLCVTNTAYFLGEANNVGKLSKRNLVIVDEADTLEGILMGQVTIEITDRRRKSLKIEFPKQKSKAESWMDWCNNEALPKVASAMAKLPTQPKDKADIKELKYLRGLQAKLLFLRDDLVDEDGGTWVYSGGGQRANAKGEGIVFKPVKVDKLGGDHVWAHGDRFLLMSATIIDPHEFTESIGIPSDQYALVNVPSTFPVANRPVVVLPVANMVKAEEETALPLMADAIGKVLRKHPEDRILVHCVSYGRAQFFFDALRKEFGGRLVIYGSAKDREMALEIYKQNPGSVMLAASMDRGIDLPGELCRVQVVAKVPFPNLGDEQVKARLYGKGGDLWYGVQAVRSLVQMTGRGVRSETDHAVTYILDKQFMTNIYSKHRMLLPRYWKDSLDFSGGGLR